MGREASVGRAKVAGGKKRGTTPQPRKVAARPRATAPDAGAARGGSAPPKGATPRYVEVAATLRAEITSGRHRVGDRLPTEHELRARFGVSRSTIRQALDDLEDEGLVERRQGSGTTVAAQQPQLHYVLALDSEHELLRYVAETTLEIMKGPQVVSMPDRRRLRLGDTEKWCSWRGVRRGARESIALGLTTFYLPAAYSDVMKAMRSPSRRTVFDVLNERHGLTVTAVDTFITATTLDEEEAHLLEATVGAPALVVTRRFMSESSLFEVTETLHPADRFSYDLRLRKHR